MRLVQQALQEAGVTPQQIGCIAFTKVGLPACLPLFRCPFLAAWLLCKHGGERSAWGGGAKGGRAQGGPLSGSALLLPANPPTHSPAPLPLPLPPPAAGARHGRSPCLLRSRGAHAVAAVARPHRGGEPLRGAH